MIALLDYGAGNLTSVRKALAAVGADVHVPRDPAELRDAGGVIVPGVGNFLATAAMDERWREAIVAVIGEGRPLLGICLGLQWLFEGSTEAPDCAGLGLMAGRCDRLPGGTSGGATLKVPHVGWNALELPRRSNLLDISHTIWPLVRLNFDHLGPEVRQVLRREGTGHPMRQVDYSHSVKRQC